MTFHTLSRLLGGALLGASLLLSAPVLGDDAAPKPKPAKKSTAKSKSKSKNAKSKSSKKRAPANKKGEDETR